MDCFAVQKQFVFDFHTAATRYRFIEDVQVPILVPWQQKGEALIEQLQLLRAPPDRTLRQQCQRFAVGVRHHDLQEMIDRRAVSDAGPFARGLYILDNTAAYDQVLGLNPTAGFDPEWLIEGG